MEMLSGGEMLVRFLEDTGVKRIFGYPGGAALHIYDALFKSKKLQHILVRHEQGATHMADGFSRATGQTGVVLVTSGPGATNAVTGIATAYMDSIPMVVICGQVPSEMIGMDAFQETDIIGVSRPIVKHNLMVSSVEEIPSVLAKAFYIAKSGRPGPVVVDVPKNLTDPKIKAPYTYMESVDLRSYKPNLAGHTGQIKKAIKAILSAKSPIIYAGGGVIYADASQELRDFVELTNFPITQTLMGLGGVAGTHSNNLGMLGMHGTFVANQTMHHADLILGVGARFDDRVVNNPELFCPQATIVHIDVDPTNIDKVIQAHIPIVGDAKNILGRINQELQSQKGQLDVKSHESWWEKITSWKNQHPMAYNKNSEHIMPQEVIEVLAKITNNNAIITSDVGQHQMFVAQYYPFLRPRQWINSGGLGTMGFGFPAAVGIKLEYPDQEVVCVTGDGSIQMCLQELSTCKQYDIPVKIINLNNRYLGMVKQWQDMQYGARYSHSYMDSLPDFVKLTESYGHVGLKIEKKQDLESGLKQAFSMKDRLVFVDVSVDPEEHVYPMHIKGGAINSLLLSKETA